MMKSSLITLFSILFITASMAPAVQADTPAQLKTRMAERLSKVVSLKQKGSIGENNQGYLAARGALSASEAAIVKSENADRRAVYGLIAGKTNSNVATVGKTRAKGIRNSAPSGTWIQMPDGVWRKS